MYGGGFQGNIPPGGIVPGTATGVNPYPNNKPNLHAYLNNTPTTTSNFASPPSFAPQATHSYVPHAGAGTQWNSGAAQPNVQGHYGQAGAPAHPGAPSYPSNPSPSAYGAAAQPAGFQQPGQGFNGQGVAGVPPAGYPAGAYGAQAAQQPPAPQQSSYSFTAPSSGASGYANYAGSVSGPGPQYPQSQDAFNPSVSNRPTGYSTYSSPPPANVHPPPSTYGQPAGAASQQTFGNQGYNAGGFAPETQAQPLNQQAQLPHQAWPSTYPQHNSAENVQSMAQQWAQSNQQAQGHGIDHGKRYSVASINEPYHSSYATATPPPPAAPKPERPANSATFFAATSNLKTPGPATMSPPSTQSQPHMPAKPLKPVSASGFAGGGIGDWEHYGDLEGDDDEDLQAKPVQKPAPAPLPQAAEVPGDNNQAVEMPAVTPPQTQQPYPPNQQPLGGIHSTPQSQAMSVNPVSPPQQPGIQNNQAGAMHWNAGNQLPGQNPPLQSFQGFGQPPSQPNVQMAQNPAVQNLQQPYRTTSPTQGNQYGAGYHSPQPGYQQQQPLTSPPQVTGSNPYAEGYGTPQSAQSHSLTEQLKRQQEEQLMRQQQEQQQHMQAQIQAQLQQQQLLNQQGQQQPGFPPQNQVQSQLPVHQYGQQPHQQEQSPLAAAGFPPPNQSQPVPGLQNNQAHPQQQGYTPPQAHNADQYGQQPYGQASFGPPGQVPAPSTSDPYASHHQQHASSSGSFVQSPPQSSDGQQVPPANQYADQYGHQGANRQEHAMPIVGAPKPAAPQFSEQSTQQPAASFESQPAQPIVAPMAEGSANISQDTIQPKPAPPADDFERIEIPSDLAPYYKESIRKFVRMIVREASAKSNVDSLRIFTEFMEDETYSRGDRYADVPLHDYISDVTKGYTFAGGRQRPYTTESPDPYDASRRPSAADHSSAKRTDTLDSIDSPLTNAIEALRIGNRKGGQVASSNVEHRLPYTIEEKEETAQPSLHTSPPPPASQLGSVQNTMDPYRAPEEPVQHVKHSDTWGSQVEPAPLSLPPQQPEAAAPAPQPLNVKRQSLIPSGTPPAGNFNQPQSVSPGLEASQANEADLGHQAAILAEQWKSKRDSIIADPSRQSIPLDQSHRQSPAQNQSLYGQPPAQYHQPEPTQYAGRSPPQNQNPYQQPPYAGMQATPLAQLHSKSPPFANNPYQQPLAGGFSVNAEPNQPGPGQSSQPGFQSYKGPNSPPLNEPVRQSPGPQSGFQPFKGPKSPPLNEPIRQSPGLQSGFQPFKTPTSPPAQERMHQSPGLQSGFQQYNTPASAPIHDPIQQQIHEPYQEPPKHRDRISIDGTESSLDQGYVMVTPEPERTPVNPIVIPEMTKPANNPPPAQSQLPTSQDSSADLSTLRTILGRDRAGLPNKLHLIAHLREAIDKVGIEFSDIDRIRKTFEVEAKKIRDENENERDRLKSEHDEYTAELYAEQKILYEDLHDIDDEFNMKQNALKEKQEKEEFDKFNKEVFTMVYNMIQERLVELKKQHKAVLAVVKTATSGRENYYTDNNKPNLHDTLVLLLELYDLMEAHHVKLQQAIADRDKRYKNTVLNPLLASSNYAKVRDAKKYFDEEEKKAVTKAATEAFERAKDLKTAVEDSMIPGLDLEFGFFDEVEPLVSRITVNLPADPAEYSGDRGEICGELGYAGKILETLTQTQSSMMKLYHHVNSVVNNSEKLLAIAQAKQKGEKAEAIKKIEEEKDAHTKRLDDELKERLEDVNGHFAEAKKKLDPVLEKYKV